MIKDLNSAVNLIAFFVIVLGVVLAFRQPDSSIANTLVSAGVGALTGAAAAANSGRKGSDDTVQPQFPNQPPPLK